MKDELFKIPYEEIFMMAAIVVNLLFFGIVFRKSILLFLIRKTCNMLELVKQEREAERSKN